MELSQEEFPARSEYDAYVSSGQIVGPEVIARFATWLLLDVKASRFAETEWDIRETDHHHDLSDGDRYPDSTSSEP